MSGALNAYALNDAALNGSSKSTWVMPKNTYAETIRLEHWKPTLKLEKSYNELTLQPIVDMVDAHDPIL